MDAHKSKNEESNHSRHSTKLGDHIDQGWVPALDDQSRSVELKCEGTEWRSCIEPSPLLVFYVFQSQSEIPSFLSQDDAVVCLCHDLLQNQPIFLMNIGIKNPVVASASSETERLLEVLDVGFGVQ